MAHEDEDFERWTSSVLLYGPDDQIPTVRDPAFERRGEYSFEKCPGGKRKPQDATPYDTAIRELWEETGLRPKDGKLTQVHVETHSSGHKHYYFIGFVDSFDDILEVGDEGEDVSVLPVSILKSRDFLHDQQEVFRHLWYLDYV